MLLLCQILIQTPLPDNLSKSEGIDRISDLTLMFITFRSSYLSKKFILDLIKCVRFHIFHYPLSLKYSFIIASAFAISLHGVFRVFFTMPRVATTKVPLCESQNAKSL